jgi:hypothetical protein
MLLAILSFTFGTLPMFLMSRFGLGYTKSIKRGFGILNGQKDIFYLGNALLGAILFLLANFQLIFFALFTPIICWFIWLSLQRKVVSI